MLQDKSNEQQKDGWHIRQLVDVLIKRVQKYLHLGLALLSPLTYIKHDLDHTGACATY